MKLSTSVIVLVTLAILAVTADAQNGGRRRQGGNRNRPRGRGRGPNCHLKEIDKCVELLEAISKRPQASNILATEAGVVELCDTVDSAQKCIKAYLKNCGTPIQRELVDFVIDQFIGNTKSFCEPGAIRSTFLEHSPCINENVLLSKPYHDSCVSDLFAATDKGVQLLNSTLDDPNIFDVDKAIKQTTSDTVLDLTCCGYNRFDGCSKKLIVEKCSKKAVDAMSSLVENAFGNGLNLICPKSMFNPRGELCKKVLPPLGAKPKTKLSANPLGKYFLGYVGFIFNYQEPQA
ncbi:hypothetical protein HDE_06525 [Halotydeus destructor]|nr:hypothetical protein HDE_06525 [Halotydeus destructor]